MDAWQCQLGMDLESVGSLGFKASGQLCYNTANVIKASHLLISEATISADLLKSVAQAN